ncbi:MAG: ZIP family metal transporter [Bacilli bacterium]|nr:ZIP family metal transporter [Bacilli bacterium]
MKVLLGILIPFVGTTIGASLVFFMKKNINKKFEKLLLGFASGVMIAASVWSLLIPAIELASSEGKTPWVAPALGFCTGILTLLLLDKLINYLNNRKSKAIETRRKKTTMLVLAVTLHNIPEGMAVGVVFAGLLAGNAGITIASALALAIGIGIQNFPEGAIISMPLKSDGASKLKAFICGMLSGIVEPIGAIITILLTSLVIPILPFILAFAAGAMIYVVVEELVPEFQEMPKTDFGVVGVAMGFAIMMILDVALG